VSYFLDFLKFSLQRLKLETSNLVRMWPVFKFWDNDCGGYDVKKVSGGWRRVHGLVTWQLMHYKRWRSWDQRSRSWHKNEIQHELSISNTMVCESRFTALHSAWARACVDDRGYVDDSLLVSSGSRVSLSVWNRGSGCCCLLTWIQSIRTVVLNKTSRVAAYCDLGWRMFWGAPSRRL